MNQLATKKTVQPTKKIYLLPRKGSVPKHAYLFNTNGYTWIVEGWKNACNWLDRFHPGSNGIWIIDNPRYNN